jgi:predicted RNA-binding protein Jag
MRRILQEVFSVVGGTDVEEVRDAVKEAEHAIRRVFSEGVEVSLAARNSSVRKLQHRIVSRYHLSAESVGSEPMRHLVIYPQ